MQEFRMQEFRMQDLAFSNSYGRNYRPTDYYIFNRDADPTDRGLVGLSYFLPIYRSDGAEYIHFPCNSTEVSLRWRGMHTLPL